MIPACRSLVTSFLTTSEMTGLSHLCGYLTGFAPSSNNILCMHVDGIILGMSANVHPVAFLCFLRTCSNPSHNSRIRSRPQPMEQPASPPLRYLRSLVEHASQIPSHPNNTAVTHALNEPQHPHSLRLKAFVQIVLPISLKLGLLA